MYMAHLLARWEKKTIRLKIPFYIRIVLNVKSQYIDNKQIQ